jgi:hypothetical protein
MTEGPVNLLHLFIGWMIYVIVVGLSLQMWQLSLTSRLRRRHGDRYPFWLIHRKLGRRRFGRFVLQPREQLDPEFRRDLEQMQRRVAQVRRLGDVATWLVILAVLGWVLLAYRSGQ